MSNLVPPDDPTLAQALELAEAQVKSLDGAEKEAGEKVLAYVAGQLTQIAWSKVKASGAKYRLEVWLLPQLPNRIFRSIRTILWVAGETTGPGGDEIIHECPIEGCSFLFMPGGPSRIHNHQPWYFCERCKRWIPRSKLQDNRICVGTWDVLGRHMEYRYTQLRHNATILKRILHEDPSQHLDGLLSKEQGAQDRYIKAQAHRDGVFYLWEDIVRATAAGSDLAKHFQSFLQA